MALSDVCYEAGNDLAKAMHNYGTWDYAEEHWVKLIDAMFMLADIAAHLDNYRGLDESAVRNHANRIVLSDLLHGDVSSEKRDETSEVLARVAKHNPRLAEAIGDAYRFAKSEQGIALTLSDSSLIIHVEKVHGLIHT